MVIFIELVQYAKNLGGKSRKNLVEHPIIRNDKKISLHHLSVIRTPQSTLSIQSVTWAHTDILFPNLALQILKFLKKCRIANYM